MKVARGGEDLHPSVMWAGVRMFGRPGSRAPWRWGYAWPVGRGYAAVTAAEDLALKAQLARFCAAPGSPKDQVAVVCAR